MERAKARQDASSRLAKDADREAPLPDDTEGFSDEPVDLELLQQTSNSNGGNEPTTQATPLTETQSPEPASGTAPSSKTEADSSETGGNE